MEKFKRWLGSLILLPLVIWLSLNAGEFIFLLDHFNLLIHEAGHGIFSLFGRFVYTLGGTLMQIILPLLFIYYFLSHRKKIGTQISLVWLGQNLMNISVYAADAQERNLPLLGGNKVYHDWAYLLNETGLLLYDDLVGLIIYLFGIVNFITALIVPVILKDYGESKIELNL